MSKRFHVTTFGCQMNEHDSERMKGMLESLGYAEAGERENAFGIFKNNGTTEKPGYTQAVRDLLAFPASTCPAGGMSGIPQ